jgi:hypothetical protein
MTEAEIAAYNRGIEDAAKVAEPVQRRRVPGQWAGLRIRIATEIRACKVKSAG